MNEKTFLDQEPMSRMSNKWNEVTLSTELERRIELKQLIHMYLAQEPTLLSLMISVALPLISKIHWVHRRIGTENRGHILD